MPVQDLSSIRVAMKAQSDLGTFASGAAATGLELTPSSGLAMQVQQIESQLIRTSRMRKRPRHGSRSTTASYQTEMMVGAQETVWQAGLGGTWAARIELDQTDFTSLTITGTGTIITAGGGSFITEGLRAGMMILLTDMSEAANNAKWVPIVTVTASVITVPTGFLVDNTTDSACALTVARNLVTADPYVKRYFTLEERWADVTESKVGHDQILNEISIGVQPNSMAQLSFGFGGRDMIAQAAEVFTTPVFTSGPSLTLLDGGIYKDGVKRLDATGLTLGLAAPVTTVPMIASNLSPDVFLGQFALTGQTTGVVQDGDVLDDFTAETQLSVFLHFKEQLTENFVSVYAGNVVYGGHSSPAGGEGATIQTLQLWGGADERGTGYAPTSLLVSTSHVPA